MKKLLLFLLPVLLLASCAKDYHNKIVGRSVAQSCPFAPATDSVMELVAAGMVHLQGNIAGNPNICDSVYTVEYTTYQKWHSGYKADLFIGIGIVIVLMGIFIYLTSTGTKGKWTLVFPFAAILIGGSFIGGFYYFNTERDIRKIDYYSYPGGDLETFWDTPAQTY